MKEVRSKQGFCKVMTDVSVELILGRGEPQKDGMLLEDVWANHARDDVAGRRMKVFETGRKRRIIGSGRNRRIVRARRRKRVIGAGMRKRMKVRAGRRRMIIRVVAGLSKSCQ